MASVPMSGPPSVCHSTSGCSSAPTASRSPRFKGFSEATHDLDVLLRHRLLRQPDGFEGFVTGRVLAATRKLSASNRVDERFRLIDFDAAALGASAESLNRDYRIPTGVDQFHLLEPELVEHVDPVLEPCPHGVLAMDRTGVVGSTLDCPVDDIVGEMLHEPIQPFAGKRLIGHLHDLDVLLRHSPA